MLSGAVKIISLEQQSLGNKTRFKAIPWVSVTDTISPE